MTILISVINPQQSALKAQIMGTIQNVTTEAGDINDIE